MLQQPPECLVVAFFTLFAFIPSLISDFFMSLHRSCVSSPVAGFTQGCKFWCPVLMSERLLASNKTSSTHRVRDRVLCLLNASAITASHCPRLLLEALFSTTGKKCLKGQRGQCGHSLPPNAHGPVIIFISSAIFSGDGKSVRLR